MSSARITGVVSPTSKAKIKTDLDGAKGELPFLISLTKAERSKLRKIGPGRTGYVHEVYTASNANKNALPPSFNLDEYNSRMALYQELHDVLSWLNTFKDSIESTMMAAGSDLLKGSDKLYGYLKIAASNGNDENLNTTIKKIADILKQTKRKVKKA